MENHRDKLGIEEYRQHVLGNLSNIIVNPNYVSQNIDFFNNVIFKMFQIYDNPFIENISINQQIKHLEVFLAVMIKEKPTLELPDDTVKVC